MSDVKIIPITPAYRQNYERIFQRQETQDTWERPNGGRSYVQRPCKGKHIDDECVHRGCENAEYGCVIQELKKRRNSSTGNRAPVCSGDDSGSSPDSGSE